MRTDVWTADELATGGIALGERLADVQIAAEELSKTASGEAVSPWAKLAAVHHLDAAVAVLKAAAEAVRNWPPQNADAVAPGQGIDRRETTDASPLRPLAAGIPEMLDTAEAIAVFLKALAEDRTPEHAVGEVVEWADDLAADLATLNDAANPS